MADIDSWVEAQEFQITLDADGKIKFNRVDVPSFQIIKRSWCKGKDEW